MMDNKIFPHLAISENLTDAIRTVTKPEWDKFFDSILRTQEKQIATIANDQLTTLQGKIKMIAELEGIFLGILIHK